MQSVLFEEAKQQFDSLCEKACQDHEPYIINRANHNHVVLMSLEDFMDKIGLSVCLPVYTQEIIDYMSQKEWLFTAFRLKDPSQLYNPGNYLLNKLFGDKYVLVLDTNIYDFLIKSLKRGSENENCRRAVSLLVFCHISEIEIEPALAVQERLVSSSLQEILRDIEIFDGINNADTDILANYALGNSPTLEIKITNSPERRTTVAEKFEDYEKPDEWWSIYLMILRMAAIDSDTSIQQQDKIGAFLDWSVREFRFSLPALVYALILFGKPHRRLPKMMKYKTDQPIEEKSRNLNNMAWDLLIIKDFFKKWVEKSKNQEFMFASDDNVFGAVLNLAIQVQKQGDLDVLRPHLSESDFKKATKLAIGKEYNLPRVYGTPEWTSEYRENKIQEYERELGLRSTA